jgi:hypothetical protein
VYHICCINEKGVYEKEKWGEERDVPANFDDSRISHGLRQGKSAVAITRPFESKKMLMM